MIQIFRTFLLCSLLLLTGCIDVDNAGDMWSKAALDPALEGFWKYSNEDDPDPVIGFIRLRKENDYYVTDLFDRKNQPLKEKDSVFYIKSLMLGKNTYMLVRDASKLDKPIAMIWPYRIKDAMLQTYQLKGCTGCSAMDISKVAAAIKQDPARMGSRVVSLRIGQLNDRTLSELDYVFLHNTSWTPWIQGEKLKDSSKP